MSRLLEVFEFARAGFHPLAGAVSEAVLGELYERGRRAHPGLEISDQAFVTHLARCGARVDEDPATVYAEDLYLACACVGGDAAAIRLLRAEHHPKMAMYIRQRRLGDVDLDEIEERLWDIILIGDERGPRLASYSGTGALGRWIGVSAQRIAITMMRRQGVDERARAELAAQARLLGSDPELEAIKERYRDQVQRAIDEAIATLDARDKALYRMHFIDGLTLQSIGKVYSVHHTTVLRWLEVAGDRVVDHAKDRLRAILELSPSEFESLVRLLMSQLEVRISRPPNSAP